MKPLDPIARALTDGATAAVYRRLDDVDLWARNPRKNDDAAKALAQGIKRLGFGSACLTWRDPDSGRDVLIAGNTRAKAMRILQREVKRGADGWHANAVELARSGLIPCRARDDLSRREAELMALEDNRLGEKAEWDDAALTEVLSQFSLDEAALAGWSTAELDKLSHIDTPSEVTPRTDFQVVITLDDEASQLRVLEWAQEQGYTCRALI